MYCLHLLISAALLGLFAAATPIPHTQISLHILRAPNCNNVRYFVFEQRNDKVVVSEKDTAHIPRAINATSTESEDDPPDNPTIQPKNESDGYHYPEAFLEGDSDAGGESEVGNTAVSVANGLLGSVGAGSAVLNSVTSGSTTSVCSLFACTSAAQSDGKVSTTATGARINVTSPHISVTGPLVVVAVASPGVRR